MPVCIPIIGLSPNIPKTANARAIAAKTIEVTILRFAMSHIVVPFI
jgi:hypothetical protein